MRPDPSLAVSLACSLFVSIAAAQVSSPPHLVHDWSTRHVVFTGLTPENVAGAVRTDPRAWHSWLGRTPHHFTSAGGTGLEMQARPSHHSQDKKKLREDWQMPIGTGVGPLAFPAKFGFDVEAAPDCANDYVVFPTTNLPFPGASGAGVNATVIAFNNLYTGPGPTGICPTPQSPATQPSVLFAYNTATTTNGKADLSPVLSLDGKKIAFVESNDGFLSNYTAFHVLTWIAGEGTATSAAVPGNCSAGNSCMTTLVLSDTHSDSRSNAFVDYAHDTAYVGDDGGLLHKITPVFNGTPAEVTGNGWPVQLDSVFAGQAQSPVFDSVSGRIFVTDSQGRLFVVDAASGELIASRNLSQFSPSDPIVDSTNQTVFVFFPDSSFNLTVAQFDTSAALMRQVGVGAIGGNVNVFTGQFDNNYFISPSSGALYFAGAVAFHASLYSVGFTGKTLNATFSGPLVLSNSSMTSVPGPLTEIFNPTFSSAPDRLFLGNDTNCTSANNNGCIESFDISNGFPSAILNSHALATNGASLHVSGIVIDNVSSSAQASSIYFESFLTVPSPSAIKLTQSGLQ